MYKKNEVLEWLEEISLGRHATGFLRNGIQTYAQLQDVAASLTMDELENNVGILDRQEREAVFQHIQKMVSPMQ